MPGPPAAASQLWSLSAACPGARGPRRGGLIPTHRTGPVPRAARCLAHCSPSVDRGAPVFCLSTATGTFLLHVESSPGPGPSTQPRFPTKTQTVDVIQAQPCGQHPETSKCMHSATRGRSGLGRHLRFLSLGNCSRRRGEALPTDLLVHPHSGLVGPSSRLLRGRGGGPVLPPVHAPWHSPALQRRQPPGLEWPLPPSVPL